MIFRAETMLVTPAKTADTNRDHQDGDCASGGSLAGRPCAAIPASHRGVKPLLQSETSRRIFGCEVFAPAASNILMPLNHAEPRWDFVGAQLACARSAIRRGGRTRGAPLRRRIDQTPTVGSVAFHLSRQLAWREQESEAGKPALLRVADFRSILQRLAECGCRSGGAA